MEQKSEICSLCLEKTSASSFVKNNKLSNHQTSKLLFNYLFHQNVRESVEFGGGEPNEGDKNEVHFSKLTFSLTLGDLFGSPTVQSEANKPAEEKLVCGGCCDQLEILGKLHQKLEDVKKKIESQVSKITHKVKNQGNPTNVLKCSFEGQARGSGVELSMGGSVVGEKRISETLQFLNGLCGLSQPQCSPSNQSSSRQKAVPTYPQPVTPACVQEGSLEACTSTQQRIVPESVNQEIGTPINNENVRLEVEEGDVKLFVEFESSHSQVLQPHQSAIREHSFDYMNDFGQENDAAGVNEYSPEQNDPLAIDDEEEQLNNLESQLSSLLASGSHERLRSKIKRKTAKTQSSLSSSSSKTRRKRPVISIKLPKEEFEKYQPPSTRSADVTCSICHQTFSSNQKLRLHFRNHNVDAELYKCDQCNSTFTLQYNLLRHRKQYHHQ